MTHIYKIYRLTFSDGMQYVGMTRKSIDERLHKHSLRSDAVNKQLYLKLQEEKPVVELLNSTSFGRYNASLMEQEHIKEIPEDKRLNIVVKGSPRKIIGSENGTYQTRARSNKVKPVKPGKYVCSTCRALKDHTEFHKDCTRFNGLHSCCKECKKSYHKYKSMEGKKTLKDVYKKTPKLRLCRVDGCNNTHHSKGYCVTHYMRIARHGTLDRINQINTGKICLVDGCTQKAYSLGKCKSCYNKQYKKETTNEHISITTRP